MFNNNTDNINALDEVAFYWTIYQFSEQIVTSKLLSPKTPRQVWTACAVTTEPSFGNLGLTYADLVYWWCGPQHHMLLSTLTITAFPILFHNTESLK